MGPTIEPQCQPVPVEVGGKWIAWSSDGLRIVGHLGFFEHFDATFSSTDKIVTLIARGS